MVAPKPIVLVLWSNLFDELAAAAFLCELRDAGIKTHLVGLEGRYARGRHGLVLGADLTLEQAAALRSPVSHVVVPCPEELWLNHAGRLPVLQLLAQVRRQGSILVAPYRLEGLPGEEAEALIAPAAAFPAAPLPETFCWEPDEPPQEAARRLSLRF